MASHPKNYTDLEDLFRSPHIPIPRNHTEWDKIPATPRVRSLKKKGYIQSYNAMGLPISFGNRAQAKVVCDNIHEHGHRAQIVPYAGTNPTQWSGRFTVLFKV